MLDYYITKYNEKENEFFLHCICGTNKEHAENVLAKERISDPNGIYKLESDEYSKNWWNLGSLD